jgi:hypothetical protein
MRQKNSVFHTVLKHGLGMCSIGWWVRTFTWCMSSPSTDARVLVPV